MFNVGDKVVWMNHALHHERPEFYPPIGTIGEVIGIAGNMVIDVQRPAASTSLDDCWCCNPDDVIKVGCDE